MFVFQKMTRWSSLYSGLANFATQFKGCPASQPTPLQGLAGRPCCHKCLTRLGPLWGLDEGIWVSLELLSTSQSLLFLGSFWFVMEKEERCLLPVSFPRERKPYLEQQQQWCSTIKRLHFPPSRPSSLYQRDQVASVNEMHDWKARAASFKRLLCCFYVVMWPLTISASKAQPTRLPGCLFHLLCTWHQQKRENESSSSSLSHLSSPGWGCKGTKQTPSSHIHKHSTNMGQWWCSQTCIACGNLC